MKPTPTRHLAVLRRSIADGVTVITRDAVACPPRERIVDVSLCEGCEYCASIEREGELSQHRVECTEESNAPTPRLSAGGAMHTAATAALARESWLVRSNASIDYVTSLLSTRSVSAVCVIDGEGRPVGVVTRGDLLRARENADVRISSVMTALPANLSERATLPRAAAVMASVGVEHLPLVDEGGRAIGLASTAAISRWLAVQCGFAIDERSRRSA